VQPRAGAAGGVSPVRPRPQELGPAASTPRAGAAATPRHPPGGPAPGKPSILEGRVVSTRTGEGVRGALLVFSQWGEATDVRCGDDGAFQFTATAGTWALAAASAPGYLPFAPAWGQSRVRVVARPGAEVRGIRIALTPSVEYRGRVVDPRVQPVPGAEVRLLGTSAAETASMPLPNRFVAGTDGQFRFVAPDDAMLVARRDGYFPGTARVGTAARINQRVILVLRPAPAGAVAEASISGRAIDERDDPVDAALVVAYRGARMVAQAFTDADGWFTLDGLAPAACRVVATKRDLAPPTLQRVWPGTSDVVLRLASGGAVTGRVRARDTGAAVTEFTVTARSIEADNRRAAQTAFVIDDEGLFRLDGVPPGRVLVGAAAYGWTRTSEVEVVVRPGETATGVELELAPGARIAGKVVDSASREPLGGALVLVEQGGGARSRATSSPRAMTDTDGSFELSGVPSGALSLRALADGHHPRLDGGLLMAEGGSAGPVTIALRPLADGEDPHLERSGLGATFRGRPDALVITRMSPGGGAAEAGLGVGDQIVSVDGQLVASLGFWGALHLLRGADDTQVVLGIRRVGGTAGTEQPVVAFRRADRTGRR
jgi:hypothetical protein